MPSAGLEVIWCAVAAGVTSSAKTSSAPVIWLVSATESPSTSRKPKPSRLTGRPAARATSASTEAKKSGRAAAATRTTAAAATASSTVTCRLVMPGNETSSWKSLIGFQESPWKRAASAMRVTVAVHERRLGLSDDDEPAVGGAQYLDRHAVQKAERRARDHLLGRSLDGAAAGDVDD